MAVSLVGLGLLLAGGIVHAQEASGTSGAPVPGWRPISVPSSSPRNDSAQDGKQRQTLSFHKEAQDLPPLVIKPVVHQAPSAPKDLRSAPKDDQYTSIQLELPGKYSVFKLESEAHLQERLRQKKRDTNPTDRIAFPEEPVVSLAKYQAPAFPERSLIVEPHYVAHGLLLFEEKNGERYGWDMGILSPLTAAGAFYFDVATLPYHAVSQICRGPETSAGKCLPGDPVPYLLYPPQFSLPGSVGEAAAVVALLAIFP